MKDCALIPRFTVSNLQPYVGQLITLTADRNSIADTSTPYWDLGNGVHLPGNTLKYRYPHAGSFPIVLTAAEARCQQVRSSLPIVVSVQDTPPCDTPRNPFACCNDGVCNANEWERCPSDCDDVEAPCSTLQCAAGCAARPSFSVSRAIIDAGTSVTFQAYPGTLASPTVNWDFGDGQHCDDQCGWTVTHDYMVKGMYAVILTAQENVCHSDQLSFPQYITVRDESLHPGDYAEVADSNFPLCLRPDQKFPATVKMRNLGGTAWSADEGYSLGSDFGIDPFTGTDREPIAPGISVSPGQTHTFHLALKAPTVQKAYSVQWQMYNEPGGWFGKSEAREITVSNTCQTNSGPGDFNCNASIRRQNGSPVPDIQVSLEAYTYDEEQNGTMVAYTSKQTDATGRASLSLDVQVPIQKLSCRAYDVSTISPPYRVVADPIAVPTGTTLNLDLTLSAGIPRRRFFPGLKMGAAEGHLYQNGPYDKPIVVPSPFDADEQTPKQRTWRVFEELFAPLLNRGGDLGYDIWLVKTNTGQNIHEQAAEFAQAIDYTASELEPEGTGNVIVAGYSLGGVTARLSMSRYESDADWRSRLGVRDRLPVNLGVFGDAPLEGAHINYEMQRYMWTELRSPPDVGSTTEDRGNLNSCGAQQLLRGSYHGWDDADPEMNYRRFFITGEPVEFKAKSGRGNCDYKQDGVCVCDGGPPVFSAGLFGRGWPTNPVLIAFSDGMDGPQECYGDARDLNRDGLSVCPHVHGSLPAQMTKDDLMFRVRIPHLLSPIPPAPAPDFRYIYPSDYDLQGGSRLSSVLTEECLGSAICGGFTTHFSGVFIPFKSAIPEGGSPFSDWRSLDFQGIHGTANALYQSNLDFVFQQMEALTAARRTATPVSDRTLTDTTTGKPLGTIRLFNPGETGETALSTKPAGPAPPFGFKPGRVARYQRVTANRSAVAAPVNRFGVCFDFGDLQFDDDSKVRLFQFDSEGWVDITRRKDLAAKRICGDTPLLSLFSVFEPENHPPVANAGGDARVPAVGGSASITVSGAGSTDADGDDLHFEWKRNGEVFSEHAVARIALPVGPHELTLTVTDIHGATSVDTTTVSVENYAPVVIGGREIEGGTGKLTGSYSDANGDTMQCSWSGTCAGIRGCQAFSGTGGSIPLCEMRIPVRKTYCNEFLTCSDGAGGIGSTHWNLSY